MAQFVARLVVVVVSCVLFLPSLASAQAETGNIAGVVRDTSGAVLPGVTVEAASPALIEKVRVVVTDDRGLYRIVDLRPGVYTVTFTLPGFNTFRREGIELTTTFTATVNAEMTVGSVEETITVTGAASVVDVQNVGQQTTLTRETLAAIPTSQRPSQLISLILGADAGGTNFHDVGGVGTDRGFFGVHGQRAEDMTFNFGGMDSRVFSGGGFQYNSHTFQEVVVETMGGTAEATTGGVQINVVPRDGGNVFSGSMSAEFTGPKLTSDNVDDDLRGRGLTSAPSVREYYDVGGGIGGPIQRDKLWFFASARWEDRSQYQVGNYYNKLQGTLFYEPDLSRPAYDRTFSKDIGLRLTWQTAQRHKIAVSHTVHPSCQCTFAILEQRSPLLAPEATAEHHYNPQSLFVAGYTYPVSNRLLLEFDTSRSQYFRNQKRLPETGFDAISVTDQGLDLIYGSRRTGYQTLHDIRWHERFAMSFITGTHNFKVGVDLNQFTQGRKQFANADMVNQAISYVFRDRVPNSVRIHTGPYGPYQEAYENAVYANEQWTIRRLTLNLGLRYAVYDATVPAINLPAGPYVPERNLPEVKHSPNWKNLSPRLGAAYDLFGTGRTALKVAFGRYPFRNTGVAVNLPVANMSQFTDRSWNDANRNYVPDCDLRNPVANGECGNWSDRTFGGTRPSVRFADDAREGFNLQNYNWQGSVQVQHELRQNLGVSVGYFRTWYGGFQLIDNELVTPADFDAFCVTVPTDSRLPASVSGRQFCDLYDIKREKFGQVSNVRTQASNYGDISEFFDGVDIAVNGRFSQRASLQGGVSVGRTVTDFCLTVDSPGAGVGAPGGLTAGTPEQGGGLGAQRDTRPGFCRVSRPWSSSTQVKLQAVYQLPWEFQASAIYQNLPGFPIRATYVASNAQIAPSLGRNLAACPAATGACNQNVTLDLIPTNTLFGERIKQIDLRFSRFVNLGGSARVQANFDIYNILNENTVLNENTRYGATWRNAVQIMGGRVIKVGGQLNF
ncbi:MAG: TonB-dependent receptor [Acidobacteria bacterium]|nr:TonB-dependent receptor [Acidobacteriota bacterium]